MKKAIGWILLIVLIFYIGSQPAEAADIFRGVGHGLAEIFHNIAIFLRELAT